jgi:hypothetical protein
VKRILSPYRKSLSLLKCAYPDLVPRDLDFRNGSCYHDKAPLVSRGCTWACDAMPPSYGSRALAVSAYHLRPFPFRLVPAHVRSQHLAGLWHLRGICGCCVIWYRPVPFTCHCQRPCSAPVPRVWGMRLSIVMRRIYKITYIYARKI